LLARPELVREVDKTRLPYNVPTVSQRLAAVVLDELAHEIRELASTVKAERERVATALGDVAGVDLTPSEANFLWLKTQKPAGEVFDRLAERGVLVRSFHERGGRLAHQLRVTIGAPRENDAFLSALGEVM
jgi:histidinol-phosphate aminotransferase